MAWNKGASAWGGCLRACGAGAWRKAGAWRGPGVWEEGAGAWGDGTDVHSFVPSLERTEIPPSCSIGHRSLRVSCPKEGGARKRRSDDQKEGRKTRVLMKKGQENTGFEETKPVYKASCVLIFDGVMVGWEDGMVAWSHAARHTQLYYL